jgi:hypothetical protein
MGVWRMAISISDVHCKTLLAIRVFCYFCSNGKGNSWIPSVKPLKINLNDEQIYGTFAEIGAGQEVARNFFTAGAASGTVAKTMSAYDMTFSDAIYGAEASGRYVSQNRLLRMLDHEFGLLKRTLV